MAIVNLVLYFLGAILFLLAVGGLWPLRLVAAGLLLWIVVHVIHSVVALM